MKVYVVFDFPSVKSPDGEEADQLVDHITWLTKQMHTEWCVEYPDMSVWVDDVVAEEQE